MTQTPSLTTSESEFLPASSESSNLLGYQTSSKWESFISSQQFLQNLCENFKKLESRVNQLEESSIPSSNRAASAIPLGDLGNSKYLLRSPIYVFVTEENDYFLTEAVDFDVYGVGDSEKDAIMSFKESLIIYFENLRSSSSNKLSATLRTKLILLKKYINVKKDEN